MTSSIRGLLVPLEGEICLVDIPLHPTEGYAMLSEVMMGPWTLASVGQGWVAYRRAQGFHEINYRAAKIIGHPLRGDIIFYGRHDVDGQPCDLPENFTSHAA